MEPINIYSRRIDLRGVAAVVRSLVPGAQVIGPDDNWRKIVVPGSKRWFRGPATLTFNHDSEYYESPNWPLQVFGMQNYFHGFPETPRKNDVLRLISTFAFALATDWQPDLAAASDERLKVLYAVAEHLDGVIFTPSSLRDAKGRILISANGEFDPEAVLPKIPEGTSAELPPFDGDDPPEPEPPTSDRVARRTLALAAVTARALLEQENPKEPWVADRFRDDLAWVEAVGIGDELEPDEWSVLQRPPGRLDERSSINSTWRLEGLGVLAWALGRFELPAHDELVDPQALLRSVGYPDVEESLALLANPTLRSADELKRVGDILLGLHWRLREFSLRPQAFDFRKFSKNCWFGSIDISSIRLIGNDIAIGDKPIHRAPADLVDRTRSAAMERHLAINWLHGYSNVYSKTDTST